MFFTSYPKILRLLHLNGPTKSSQLTEMLGHAGFGAALTHVQIQQIMRSPEKFMVKIRMLAEEAQIQLANYMFEMWNEWNATQEYLKALMKELTRWKHKHHRRRHVEPLPEDDIFNDAFYDKPVREFEKAFHHLMKVFKGLFKKLKSIEKKTAAINNNFNQLEESYKNNMRGLKKEMLGTLQNDFVLQAFDIESEQLKFLLTNKKMHPLLKELQDLKELFKAEKVSNELERRLLIRELNLLAVLLADPSGKKILGTNSDIIIHYWDELRPLLRVMRAHPFYQAVRKRWDEHDQEGIKLHRTYSSQLSQLQTRKAELQEQCFKCKNDIAKVQKDIQRLYAHNQDIAPLPDNVISLNIPHSGMGR